MIQRGKSGRRGEPGIVFSYRLENAWCGVLNTVKVIDGKTPVVRYSFSEESLPGYMPPLEDSELGIGKDELERIRELLEDDRLYEKEWLEDPFDVAVLDGYAQAFELENRGKHICAQGYNIDFCRGDMEHCLHSALMIQVLENVQNILVPLGVPAECFRLGL